MYFWTLANLLCCVVTRLLYILFSQLVLWALSCVSQLIYLFMGQRLYKLEQPTLYILDYITFTRKLPHNGI